MLNMSNKSISEIRAVIFDMGKTLLDYDTIPFSKLSELYIDEITNFLNQKGYKVTQNHVNEYLIKPYYEKNLIESEKTLHEVNLIFCIKEGLEKLNVAEDYSLWIVMLMHKILKQHLIIYNETKFVLEKLNEKFILGLISNTTIPGIFFNNDLDEIKLLNYFKHVLFTADWGFRKPHSSVFYRMLQLLDITPNEAIYVGDSFKNDVYGPTCIGMKTIWLNPNKLPKPIEFSNINPTYEISSLNEILKIFNL